MHSDALLVIVIVAALAFDFTNGFHDTANVVATSISTRALSPRSAIAVASVLNFAGAFISLKVAATIATGIIDPHDVTESIAFAGLAGAIAWNLITWFYGLPSSSSHALIGAIVGALLAGVGGAGINVHGLLTKVVAPAVWAPLLAFVLAGLAIVVIYRLVGRRRPGPVTRGFRSGQILSGSLLALAHGTNDAQKTMGVISLALVAHGSLSSDHFHVPLWVVIVSATTMALGTYAGGWRIIRTVGSRIIRMNPAQGFACQGAGAVVILVSSRLGYPLSSTHVISGGVMGAGAATRLSAVRWGVAGNIAIAWALTLPAAAAFGAIAYWLQELLGAGVFGPLVISAAALFWFGRVLLNNRTQIAQTARAKAAGGLVKREM
jgi:PiT family inorganic phosphate transporter